jgi:hypothetical protein
MRKKPKRTVFLKMCYNYSELTLFLYKQYTHKSDNQILNISLIIARIHKYTLINKKGHGFQ